jgi:hypothetical protein
MHIPWMSHAVPRMQQDPNPRIPAPISNVQLAVSPLSAVVRLFVNTFGITQPAPEAEARAGRIIALMLVGVVVLLGVVALVLRGVVAR